MIATAPPMIHLRIPALLVVNQHEFSTAASRSVKEFD
jgi:hypothetical protein